MRSTIKKIFQSIKPLDIIEQEHISNTLDWIDSGEEIFRIKKPDIPVKHLIAYFVLLDPKQQKILLLDHIKAELWLPSGGHVELNEHPKVTVERESVEELNQKADFLLKDPVFVSQTVTVGKTAGHTDVCLWYVLKGDSKKNINYSKDEFNGYKWFTYEDVLDMDGKTIDQHMKRFVQKLLLQRF